MEHDDNRRGKITAENLEEARLLKEIYDAKKDYRESQEASTQAAFGHKYDIGNQSAVGFFLSGATALSLKAARGFAIGLGVKIDAFSPRLSKLAAELGELATTQKPDVNADQQSPPHKYVKKTNVSVTTPLSRARAAAAAKKKRSG